MKGKSKTERRNQNLTIVEILSNKNVHQSIIIKIITSSRYIK